MYSTQIFETGKVVKVFFRYRVCRSEVYGPENVSKSDLPKKLKVHTQIARIYKLLELDTPFEWPKKRKVGKIREEKTLSILEIGIVNQTSPLFVRGAKIFVAVAAF